MRKQLLLLTAALAFATAAQAQTPETSRPERLYLVGDFNNWATPANNASCDEWSLTDSDGDGVYTGSIKTAAQSVNFKIFDAKIDWDQPEHYFGASIGAQTAMYSDLKWELWAYPGDDYGNISIVNWAGGTLQLEASIIEGVDNSRTIYVTGTGSNQPKAPLMAETLWVVGSFNGWKLPNGDNANGALPVPMTQYGVYEGKVTFPEGTHPFAIYYLDPATEEWTKYVTNEATAPFTLYRSQEELSAMTGITLLSDDDEYAKAPTLRDWNGTEILMYADFNQTPFRTLFMSSATAPLVPRPEKLYTLYSVDDGDWQCEVMTSNTFANVISGKEIKIVFSDQPGSKLEDLPNVYGAMTGSDDTFDCTYDVTNYDLANYELPVQKGGIPFTFTCKDKDMILNYAGLDWTTQTATVNFKKMPNDVTGLYLIGSIQGWNIDSNEMKLEKVGENTYWGKFPVNGSNMVSFRFYSQLGLWGSDGCDFSFGSAANDGDNLDITLPYSGAVVNGKGNWNIFHFSGEYLVVTVDLNNWTLNVSSESGVEYIGSDNGKAVEGIYDVNGLRRDALQPGLNIVRFTDGSASKVMK